MGTKGNGTRRRVLVPQALGSDEFLRVTWHEDRDVMVFSHWRGDQCVAATPVKVADIGEVAELTVAALARGIRPTQAWPAPDAGTLVVPAAGFVTARLPRSA